MASPYLFSIDLEDIRDLTAGAERHAPRVPENTERLLDFLERRGLRVTFFCVGAMARRHPDLVREVAARGHEIACHTSDHTPLDRHDRESFRADVLRNLEELAAVGVEGVTGFRAPMASLVEETAWAWEVLADLGFTYSSSVIAARNPLYGWPGFGTRPRRMESGIFEVPITLSGLPLLDVPFCGGVYFRVLPFPLVRLLFRREQARGRPVVGYLHPYDIDTEQERFDLDTLNGSRFMNALMYRNRHAVLPRLDALFDGGSSVMLYRDYVGALAAGG